MKEIIITKQFYLNKSSNGVFSLLGEHHSCWSPPPLITPPHTAVPRFHVNILAQSISYFQLGMYAPP